jgi:hypothetical protein
MDKCISIHKDDNLELDIIKGETHFVLMASFVGVHGPEMVVSRAISADKLRTLGTRLLLIAAGDDNILKP